MESPTNINDVFFEAKDVSEPPPFGCSSEGSNERFDDVDLEPEFLDRACVLKSPPNFLRGMYRCFMRFVLTGVDRCREGGDQVGLTKGRAGSFRRGFERGFNQRGFGLNLPLTLPPSKPPFNPNPPGAPGGGRGRGGKTKVNPNKFSYHFPPLLSPPTPPHPSRPLNKGGLV